MNLRKFSDFAGRFLLVSSLIANIGLAWQPLQSEYRSIKNYLLPVQGSLKVGTALPSLIALDLNGLQRSIPTTGDVPTVFYIFKPSCRFCALNLDGAKALGEQARGRFRIIGVSLTDDPPRDYLTKNALPFEVVYKPSELSKKQYNLGTTPSTVVVSANGTVLRHLDGTYQGPTRRALESTLGVTLPNAPKWSH